MYRSFVDVQRGPFLMSRTFLALREVAERRANKGDSLKCASPSGGRGYETKKKDGEREREISPSINMPSPAPRSMCGQPSLANCIFGLLKQQKEKIKFEERKKKEEEGNTVE
eukprot:gene7061-5001_t